MHVNVSVWDSNWLLRNSLIVSHKAKMPEIDVVIVGHLNNLKLVIVNSEKKNQLPTDRVCSEITIYPKKVVLIR